MINYGSLWQSMPDYREGWQEDKHKNAFGGLLRALDPMTYIPGVNVTANAAHDAGGEAVTGINRALSPIVGGVQKLEHVTNPLSGYLNKNVPMVRNINEFAKNKPFDAAALVAATYFSGGAASNLFGPSGGGTGAAAAPLGAGGTAAAANAITPAALTAGETAIAAPVAGASTGLGTLGAAGTSAATSAITPGFMATAAPAAGGSALGATGAQFASNAITPAFMQQGAKIGLLDTFKPAFKALRTGNKYRSNLETIADANKSNEGEARNRADNALAQMIINDPQPTIKTKKLTEALMQNQFLRGGGY